MSVTNQAEAKQPDTFAKPLSALKIVDIIHQILSRLVEDTNVKKSDLLSMARSCKAFRLPVQMFSGQI